MLSNIRMPSTKKVISATASAAATAMLIRSVTKDFVPRELRQYLAIKLRHFVSTVTNQITLVIDEYDGLNRNELFQAAEVYLGTIITPSTKRFRVTKPEKENKIHLSVEQNEDLTDKFLGIQLNWKMACKKIQSRRIPDPRDHYSSTLLNELRFFELSFHKKHKDTVIDEYLPFILEKSKIAKDQNKTLKLFTLQRDDRMMVGGRMNAWQSVNLDHPATFDTLAMDWDAKGAIMEDLERFVKRKEFYRRVGKAWKRGYLLFGPPGTGKSSLIAAMANYLNFDVYDLELTDLRNNSELRNLLISTANQSILVVEDIDCSIELQDRLTAASMEAVASGRRNPFGYNQGSGITLSGLLNFVDGLWSSCGDERIIVFTTNHKERLDPALLRPGRMDVHIHMSYCTPCGFKMLASNYLGITEHPLFFEVENLIVMKKVTPAEIGEQLMKSEEAESALRGLIRFLEEKKEECEEIKASEAEQKASGSEVLPELQGKKGGSSEK